MTTLVGTVAYGEYYSPWSSWSDCSAVEIGWLLMPLQQLPALPTHQGLGSASERGG